MGSGHGGDRGRKARQFWSIAAPNWISAAAGFILAVVAVAGLVKVNDLLKEARTKAIENHSTWIEVKPVAFLSSGQKDPLDSTSTFWYLEVAAQNLGRKTAYIHLKDWTFESKSRGKITSEAYEPKDIEFSLKPGQRAMQRFSFVMNSDYHIPLIMSGKDSMNITVKFTSRDMADKERCEYDAQWVYTKDEFTLLEDDRRYSAL